MITQSTSARLKCFALVFLGLCLAFALPLRDLVRLALADDAYSHVLLIPFISGYLIWQRRTCLNGVLHGSWCWAGFALGLSLLLMVGGLTSWFAPSNAGGRLSWVIASFVSMVLAAALACLGRSGVRQLLFPLLFLFFLVPLPAFAIVGIERFLQHASAEAAHLLFWMAGETFLRDGLQFRLPGLTIEVAQECSGLRSTLVLFITGLLAGYMFLQRNSRRVALALLVIPIAILRNGFRVFIITTLTCHVDPGIIDSPLHHRGGPIFFALSLLPLLLAIWILKCTERKQTKDATVTGRIQLASAE